MRCFRRLLLPVLIAWGALWLTPVCFAKEEAEGPGPAVRLVSPADGAALVAGSTAELVWEPLEPLPPRIEEWEAFLSLDSGKTYPIEITPHLDEDIRRVRWQVPSLPTDEAAILLRFGDERREVGVKLPVRFSIVASTAARPVWESTLHLARRASSPGEAALPGQEGVVAWVEGSRRGGSARQVVAAGAADGLRERLDWPSTRSEVAEAASEPRSSGSRMRLRPQAGGSALPVGHRAALARAGTILSPPSDILLLIQRQNE